MNKDGVPYLAQSKDGKAYELLTGTYIVKETKAPTLVDKAGTEYPGVYPELTGNPAKARLVVTAQEEAKLESTNGSAIYRGKYGLWNQAKTGSFLSLIHILGGYDSWEACLEENGRSFFYQIEGADGETDTEDAVVQTFGVRFHTRLSEAGWREYATKGELHKVFPNRAVLKDEDEVTTLTTSNKVEPRLDWSSILEKEGLPLDVNGKVYQWNIDISTKFSDGVQLYAVDCLKDIGNTHNYIWEDPSYPVTIIRNGQKETLEVEAVSYTHLFQRAYSICNGSWK